MDVRNDRVPLVDPTAARRSARRSIRIGTLVFIGLTGFTASGTAMVTAGELPGLPFAVGGAAAQVAVAVLVGTLIYARSGSREGLLRNRLATAARVFRQLQWALLAVLVVLAGYALTRLIMGDPWTLLTAGIIGVLLALLLRGAALLSRRMSEAARHEAGHE
ncbi:hypothetical protein [Micromonospora sp. CV4]|uniref:hypothetical protein n=1 Tax=Micromonospora sp. CV4 TaxID=2478711 RepID=UPI000EF46090|nr:hypothetical protein [Micromonospora sp. CV4]RLP93463.1 hypothetical protein EAD98_19040 [Micromonospora sp. CV4]